MGGKRTFGSGCARRYSSGRFRFCPWLIAKSVASSIRFDRRYQPTSLPQLALDEIVDRSGYFDGFRVAVGDYLVIDPDFPETIGAIEPVIGQRITPRKHASFRGRYVIARSDTPRQVTEKIGSVSV